MLQVIELKVRLHCKACEKALRKALCKIKGTFSWNIASFIFGSNHRCETGVFGGSPKKLGFFHCWIKCRSYIFFVCVTGVTCVEIDAMSHKIRVMGYVERKVILKAVWKTGTRAVELSQPNQSHHHHKKSTLNGFACIIPKWVLS